LTLPAKVRYRSMLEGFDREWTPSTTARSASYTNLPPGRFRFRVQATNNDGLWSDPGAAVSFRVLAPLYRRSWFALLLVGAAALLALALYRLRMRQLQRRFSLVLAERNRIAREIHDTLAQDFVGVAVQLDLLAQLLNPSAPAEALTQLKVTRSLVKSGLEAARQGIWNLRAGTTQQALPAQLAATLRRFAAEDPSLTPHSKIGGAYRALPRATEEELLRIAQEAISNVSRHARATTVTVDLYYGPETLVLTVADNGLGFSPEQAQQPGHFGMQGMRERAQCIAASLAVNSSPGRGTTLTVTLRLPPEKEHR
jgi:signal transduction histidine kinase